MLQSLCIKLLRVDITKVSCYHRGNMKSSDNISHADKKQERLNPSWIVGFTDGEGCFTISIIRNTTTRIGWQVFPEFVISQGEKSKSVLFQIQEYFSCGIVKINRRHDNHREHMYRYAVRSIKELNDIIIPFFDEYQLHTSKRKDFLIFKKVVKIMSKSSKRDDKFLQRISKIVSLMNTKKKRRI